MSLWVFGSKRKWLSAGFLSDSTSWWAEREEGCQLCGVAGRVCVCVCGWVCECQSVRTRSVCVLLLYSSCVVEDYKHIEKVSGKSFHELIFTRKKRGLCRQAWRCVSGASCLNKIMLLFGKNENLYYHIRVCLLVFSAYTCTRLLSVVSSVWMGVFVLSE